MTTNKMGIASNYGLDNHGIRNVNMVYWTLPTPALLERIVSRSEGILAHEGSLVVRTGNHTGRAPNDKFVVRGKFDDQIWWGKNNQPLDPSCYDRLYTRMTAYFQGRDVFVQDVYAGADPEHRLPIRVISESAWHSLFVRNLFLRLTPEQLPDHVPQFTILHAPGFHAIPSEDGTNSETFIILNLEKRMVLIGGSSYAGEIKKSIFTVMNFLLPHQGVLPMHCSANVDKATGDVALFFGLSGTGKTTLSSDPDRLLIGDDEHGWSDQGIFNFEGGCYAKVVRLEPDLEPMIWKASHHFGTILENVTMDQHTRRVDFDESSLTENTRAAYPIGFLGDYVESGQGGHPTHVFFLTADAFGVLPPVARLSREQAMYYFLSGYTSKLAGTEKGLGSEPQATFSACFGAPFLPLHPGEYAALLGKKLEEHDAQVWLINTGWTGGPHGVGKRMRLPYTRAMVTAALKGELDNVSMRIDPHFGLSIPEQVPGVPSEVLDPRQTWQDPDAYDQAARSMVGRFRENFTRFEDQVAPQVVEAGPAQSQTTA
jgi:phosphoenolpyruvate carboxykinase (ATP)